MELDSIYGDVELLAVKYDRLARTLPGVDIKTMVGWCMLTSVNKRAWSHQRLNHS